MFTKRLLCRKVIMKVWECNGMTRNLNFWDFYDMAEDGTVEKTIKDYRKYRDLAGVNEHIVYNMVGAHIFHLYEMDRRFNKRQINTAINYLGGVGNVGCQRYSDFMARRILPLLKKNLHRRHYAKVVDWMSQSDKH